MIAKVASNIKTAQSIQKEHYDKKHQRQEFNVGDQVLLKNLVREDRKGGRFTERRTGPYTVAEVCGKNTYLLSDQSKVLKKKVNSKNLTRYIVQPSSRSKKHKANEEPQGAPAPKRTRLEKNPRPVAGNSPEITQSIPADCISITPVCEDWQKFHSGQLNLDFVSSTRIKHGSSACNIPTNQPLKTCRIEPDGNCLFRSFSQILTGTQENNSQLRAIIVSFILDNGSLLQSVCTNVEEHINTSKMANHGTWGTEIEIFAMATILNCRIYVYSKHGKDNNWLEYKRLKTDMKDIHADEVIMISNMSHHYEPAIC